MKRIAALLALLIAPIAHGQEPEQKVDRQQPITIEGAAIEATPDIVVPPPPVVAKTNVQTEVKWRRRILFRRR
jgi:hypothetical protein